MGTLIITVCGTCVVVIEEVLDVFNLDLAVLVLSSKWMVGANVKPQRSDPFNLLIVIGHAEALSWLCGALRGTLTQNACSSN